MLGCGGSPGGSCSGLVGGSFAGGSGGSCKGFGFLATKTSFFASVTKTNSLLRGLFHSCGGVSGKMAKIAGEQAKGLAALKQIGLSGV